MNSSRSIPDARRGIKSSVVNMRVAYVDDKGKPPQDNDRFYRDCLETPAPLSAVPPGQATPHSPLPACTAMLRDYNKYFLTVG